MVVVPPPTGGDFNFCSGVGVILGTNLNLAGSPGLLLGISFYTDAITVVFSSWLQLSAMGSLGPCEPW